MYGTYIVYLSSFEIDQIGPNFGTRWSKSVQIGLNLSKIGDGIFENICQALTRDLKLDCNL